MARVATYVFIDLETTGLPREEFNKTRITELSMVAVKRQHVLETQKGKSPRVQHKLTLCLNPRRMVSADGTTITGLCNDLLEHEPEFNLQVFTMIDTFLSVLSKPVCLIAQNGLSFDFPILKNHLVKLNREFTSEVLCADCYHAFYHILERGKLEEAEIINKSGNGDSTRPSEDIGSKQGNPSPSSTPQSNTKQLANNIPSTSTLTEFDEIDYETLSTSMQATNETTPKKILKISANFGKPNAKRQLFPWGDGRKPTDSYKLNKIYERVLNKPADNAHRAENDCIFALEISVALKKQFVEWIDKNHVMFSDIEPMTIGVPMK